MVAAASDIRPTIRTASARRAHGVRCAPCIYIASGLLGLDPQEQRQLLERDAAASSPWARYPGSKGQPRDGRGSARPGVLVTRCSTSTLPYSCPTHSRVSSRFAVLFTAKCTPFCVKVPLLFTKHRNCVNSELKSGQFTETYQQLLRKWGKPHDNTHHLCRSA